MKLSVIMTVYNKTGHLRNALISLLSQSVMPDELIIADDGSSEDIIGGIGDLIPKLPFPAKHVRQDNKGFRAGKNRNNGARNATGDHLVFYDQDLIFTKNFLEKIIVNIRPLHFYTGFPIWLTEEQTRLVVPDVITSCDYGSITTPEQRHFIVKQYRKEWLYTWLHKYRLRRIGPSLRSGDFAICKNDFILVNGFDEEYQGWGYEDDDLGRRLYAAGVKGFNPIKIDYAMHCYHPPSTRPVSGEKSLNSPYYLKRKREISRKNYRCEYGILSPLGEDTTTVTRLN